MSANLVIASAHDKNGTYSRRSKDHCTTKGHTHLRAPSQPVLEARPCTHLVSEPIPSRLSMRPNCQPCARYTGQQASYQHLQRAYAHAKCCHKALARLPWPHSAWRSDPAAPHLSLSILPLQFAVGLLGRILDAEPCRIPPRALEPAGACFCAGA